MQSSFEFQLEIPTFLVLSAVLFLSVVCKPRDEPMVQNFDRISLLVDLVLQAASTYEWNSICCNVLRNVPSNQSHRGEYSGRERTIIYRSVIIHQSRFNGNTLVSSVRLMLH